MVGLLFGSLFICLFLTVPIAISLAISTLVVIVNGHPNMLNMLAQAMVTSVDNYALMAIPFFMLLGIIMEKAGIARSLIDLADAFVGSKPGGLGTAAIVACSFFAAISGSGPACVAATVSYTHLDVYKRQHVFHKREKFQASGSSFLSLILVKQ